MSPRAAWRLEALGFELVYDYVAGKAAWGAAGLPREGRAASEPSSGDAADKHVPTCHLDEDLHQVRERVRTTDWEQCIVVNTQRIVLGRIGRRSLASTRMCQLRGDARRAKHNQTKRPARADTEPARTAEHPDGD
jgi:hypothetical protein